MQRRGFYSRGGGHDRWKKKLTSQFPAWKKQHFHVTCCALSLVVAGRGWQFGRAQVRAGRNALVSTFPSVPT
jgi:hypothetical protein